MCPGTLQKPWHGHNPTSIEAYSAWMSIHILAYTQYNVRISEFNVWFRQLILIPFLMLFFFLTPHTTSKKPFAWWRHFTTKTRVHCDVVLLWKLWLLLFCPHWDYLMWLWKEKTQWILVKMMPSCKWPISSLSSDFPCLKFCFFRFP